ncbi:MAG: mechanosensitive ion channel [candidate division Zixibacteria bacterium]|nr:mechanosensitive ion channel [candidate division Zixibacteria bacterium]
MDFIHNAFETLQSFWPTVIAVFGLIVVLFIVRRIISKGPNGRTDGGFRRQIVTLLVVFLGILVIVLVLPINDSTRGQLLSLIGILFTAAIALSSTTFLGNIMAGFMLRSVRNFRPGDFIRVGEHFGRVSEQGLFHVEIQTEDRDLTTMPNLYLVTHPVKVIRASGTIISAEVSLGYDIPHERVEKLLLDAASAAGLEEAFVYVIELGDFSISYRVAGLLTNIKHVLSTRSHLRAMMLDKLHEGGVEIVSPTFMNTRAFGKDEQFIPQKPIVKDKVETPTAKPETLVFDKAEQAESIEKLREYFDADGRMLDELKGQLKDSLELMVRDKLKSEIEHLENRRARLEEIIKKKESHKEE